MVTPITAITMAEDFSVHSAVSNFTFFDEEERKDEHEAKRDQVIPLFLRKNRGDILLPPGKTYIK